MSKFDTNRPTHPWEPSGGYSLSHGEIYKTINNSAVYLFIYLQLQLRYSWFDRWLPDCVEIFDALVHCGLVGREIVTVHCWSYPRWWSVPKLDIFKSRELRRGLFSNSALVLNRFAEVTQLLKSLPFLAFPFLALPCLGQLHVWRSASTDSETTD